MAEATEAVLQENPVILSFVSIALLVRHESFISDIVKFIFLISMHFKKMTGAKSSNILK